MKITLVQSGGLLPVTRRASTEVDWTKEESDDVLRQITIPYSQEPSPVRDGIDFTLEINGSELTVDVDKASGKYARVFNHLKKNLQIVATNFGG